MVNNPSPPPFEEALAATIRAIGADPQIKVTFSRQITQGNTVDYKTTSALLPTPSYPLNHAGVERMRGEADAAALALRYHNDALHQALAPKNHTSRQIFERAEQMRVEALGALAMQGVSQNLAQRLEHQFKRQGVGTVVDNQDAPLADIIGLLIRQELTGLPHPPSVANLMEEWGRLLHAKIQKNLLPLKEMLGDQEGFARHMLTLIEHLHLSEQPFSESEDGRDEADSDRQQQPQEEEDNNDALASLPGMQASASEQMPSSPKSIAASLPGEESEGDESITDYPFRPEPSHNEAPFHPSHYHAFTTQFDEIVRAEDLCSHEELARLRQQLDMKLSSLKNVTNRLANRLQRLLLARQSRTLELHREEGILDSSKLAQLIMDPTYPLAYRWERVEDDYDTVITLLLDNSGSMRGRPITVAAMSADILARTLERCGISVEILGFTSRDWKGGNAKKYWQQQGSPPNPGRLNDLRHIIYKSADQPWRRVRKNLGLMLKEGILKENIDGEAILWAHDRLLARKEQRRILMVISDGAPVDDSTLSVNSSDYLENHLKEVIYTIENYSPVELLAIGIGHDVTRYYKHAVTIREVEQLSDTMFRELAELLER